MARYGPADATVTYSSQLIPDCTVISEIDLHAIIEEITPIGSAVETHAYVGVKGYGPITLEAPYSDDSNNLRDKADDVGIGGTATLAIVFGGTKSLSISTVQKSQKRAIARGGFTVFRVELQPTGSPTEA